MNSPSVTSQYQRKTQSIVKGALNSARIQSKAIMNSDAKHNEYSMIRNDAKCAKQSTGLKSMSVQQVSERTLTHSKCDEQVQKQYAHSVLQ